MKQLVFTIVAFLAAFARADDRPNIVFMLSDDQNWNGTSVAMHPDVPFSKSDIVQTPSLEKLAAQGMRFSAAYAPASVCSPTRCSLQLGKSPAQTRWTKAAPTVTAASNYRLIPPRVNKSLSRDETMIGELLQQAGYATAHYGKWHLSSGGPGQHGYDEHDGDIGNEYAGRFTDPNPVDIFGMAERASAFMEQSSKAGKPFFIQMSWHALHSPENALKSTIAKYEKLAAGQNAKGIGRAAITENLDTGVGRVVDAVDRLGLADNTYVIYMSDNGGGGGRRGASLRGGKGSVWEGGIRSPLIVRGPGVAANSWCHQRVVGFDFFNTFCEWAKIPNSKLPKGIEGGSVSHLLAGDQAEVKRPRKELVFHFPHYQSGDGPHSAILLGNYKLMKFYEDNRLALFDISTDITEQNDLTQRKPEMAAKLDKMLMKYLSDAGAQLPQPNPQYDPTRQPSTAKSGRGGGSRDGGSRIDPLVGILDANGDGKLSASELKGSPKLIRSLDKNKDGVISQEEIRR